MVEGEVNKLCVSNIDSKQSVVRDIPVSLTFAVNNITTGKMCKSGLCCQSLHFVINIYLDYEDFRIRNLVKPTVINPGMFQTCFDIEAVDDVFVEGDEVVIVIAEARNVNDVVTTNAAITIGDNDGTMYA